MTTDAPKGGGNLADSVATGAGWMIAISFVGRMIDATGVLILARLLTPEDFGLVALATTLFNILSVITDLQVSNALIRLPNLSQQHYSSALSLSIARSAIVIFGLLVGGVALSAVYHDRRVFGLCAMLCLAPLASGLISPRYVLYSREMRFVRISVLEISSKLIGFAAMTAIALSTRSYWSLVTGPIVSSVALSVLVGILLPYKMSLSTKSWPDILSFSVWTNLTSITSTLSGRLDNFFVAGFLSRSALGYYVLGDQFANILYSAILQPLQRVLYPGFTQLAGMPDRLNAAFVRSQQMLAMAALPVGVGIALIADPVIALLLGAKWKTAAVVVQFVSPVFAFQAMVAPINAVVLALGKQKLLFSRSLLILFVRLPLILGGIYFYGLYGMLIARILSGGFVVVLFNALLAKQVIGLSVLTQLRHVSRSLIAAAVMASGAVLVQQLIGPGRTTDVLVLQLVITLVASVVLFAGTHLTLWALVGKPAGAERDMTAIVTRILHRRMRRKTS